MQAGWHNTEQAISCAALKKFERDGRGCVFFVLIERTFSRTKWIEKRTQVNVAPRVDQMYVHGRKIRTLAILFDRIVRCEESCSGNDPVKEQEDDEPFR
jgi:hypothetical protein